jgi:AraC-like DNA-binding protein
MMRFDEHYGTDSGLCVHRIGSEVAEPPGFTIDRPKGSGDFDFLHFASPLTVLVQGRRVRVRPGACILFSPGTPQWYTGGARPFTHDWFHFYGPMARRLVRVSGVPLDRVLYPGATQVVTDMVRAMCLELIQKQPCWQYALSAMVQELLITVRRRLQPVAGDGRGALKAQVNHRIADVRVAVHARPEQEWSVSGMARRACLSRTHFTLLYRRLFDVSPMEDLIRSRLQRARWLLENSTTPVRQIALQLGFEDPAYFSRLFSRRVGVTPARYRMGLARQ